ncbi:hypothetical protein ES703_64289 [subsurface metagenome]
MSPPQLPRDTPIPNIFQPVEINLFPSGQVKGNITSLYNLNCLFCKRFHFYEPLFRKIGLNYCIAAVTVANRIGVLCDLLQESHLFQITNKCFSGIKPIHSLILTCFLCHFSFTIYNKDYIKIMSFRYLEIIRIVCWSDLYESRSKFWVYKIIFDYLYLSPNYWDNYPLIFIRFKSFISRMICKSCITKHRFGSCCSYGKKSLFTFNRIFYIV